MRTFVKSDSSSCYNVNRPSVTMIALKMNERKYGSGLCRTKQQQQQRRRRQQQQIKNNMNSAHQVYLNWCIELNFEYWRHKSVPFVGYIATCHRTSNAQRTRRKRLTCFQFAKLLLSTKSLNIYHIGKQ